MTTLSPPSPGCVFLLPPTKVELTEAAELTLALAATTTFLDLGLKSVPPLSTYFTTVAWLRNLVPSGAYQLAAVVAVAAVASVAQQ